MTQPGADAGDARCLAPGAGGRGSAALSSATLRRDALRRGGEGRPSPPVPIAAHRAPSALLFRPLGLHHRPAEERRTPRPAPVCPVRPGKPLPRAKGPCRHDRTAAFVLLRVPGAHRRLPRLCPGLEPICRSRPAAARRALSTASRPFSSLASDVRAWECRGNSRRAKGLGSSKRWCGVYLLGASTMIPWGEEPFDFAFMLYIDFL